MASYHEFKGMTVKEVMNANKYMQPHGVFCNGERRDIKRSLNSVVRWVEVQSGIIYYHIEADGDNNK